MQVEKECVDLCDLLSVVCIVLFVCAFRLSEIGFSAPMFLLGCHFHTLYKSCPGPREAPHWKGGARRSCRT